MTVAHCVDIIKLHKLYVAQHRGLVDIVTQLGERMTVYTLDKYGFAVETILTVLNLRSAETDVTSECLGYLAGLILKEHFESIEIGIFGAPRLNVLYNLGELQFAFDIRVTAYDLDTVGIIKRV